MLAACVALAVLIAFSLQKLVPHNLSGNARDISQSVQNQEQANVGTSEQSAAGDQSGTGVDARLENASEESASEVTVADAAVSTGAGSVEEAASESASEFASENEEISPDDVAGDANNQADAKDARVEGQSGSEREGSDRGSANAAGLSQPTGSVLLDSVSVSGAAPEAEPSAAGQLNTEESPDSSADASDSDESTLIEPVVADQESPGQTSSAEETDTTDAVTLERIPRSSVTSADGPVDVTNEQVDNQEPLSLHLNTNAGKVIVSGILPRKRFASVLLQVLRSATDIPLDARELELIADDPRDTPWVFDIAKAVGSIDLEFSTLDLQSDGVSITVAGDVSTIEEKQRILGIFESDETSLELHPDSQILVVPVQIPQLTVKYADGEYEISGMLANAQRDLFERSVAGRAGGTGDMRWRRKVRQLEIIDSLSAIIDIMPKSLSSGELVAGPDSIELEGIVLGNAIRAGSGEAEREAARRNVVAVFSSLLPETESIRIDLELEATQLSNQGSNASVVQASSAQASAEQANEQLTADESLQDDQLTEPANEILAGNDSSDESDGNSSSNTGNNTSNNTSNSGDINNTGLTLAEGDGEPGPEGSVDDELVSTTAELKVQFEQFAFAPGQSELSDENREILDQLFEVLFLFPSLKANMGVHVTDQNRSVENLSLSRQRADGIRDYVTGLGVESYRITVAGYGDSRRANTQPVESGVTLDFSSIP